MEKTEVTDLYEAAYLVVEGSRIESVTCIPLSKTLSCRFVISGEELEKSLEEVRSRKAVVHLASFRGAYCQIQGYVHEAKKSYERVQRNERRAGGEE